jgi:hypothetical protein
MSRAECWSCGGRQGDDSVGKLRQWRGRRPKEIRCSHRAPLVCEGCLAFAKRLLGGVMPPAGRRDSLRG